MCLQEAVAQPTTRRRTLHLLSLVVWVTAATVMEHTGGQVWQRHCERVHTTSIRAPVPLLSCPFRSPSLIQQCGCGRSAAKLFVLRILLIGVLDCYRDVERLSS